LDETIQSLQNLDYIIDWKLLNAVNFSVPQNQERLIVVGDKGKFKFPNIQKPKISAGEALESMAFHSPPESKLLTSNMDEYVPKYEKSMKKLLFANALVIYI
jgi:DNA (cytosine-5)-methyltransferase 1